MAKMYFISMPLDEWSYFTKERVHKMNESDDKHQVYCSHCKFLNIEDNSNNCINKDICDNKAWYDSKPYSDRYCYMPSVDYAKAIINEFEFNGELISSIKEETEEMRKMEGK